MKSSSKFQMCHSRKNVPSFTTNSNREPIWKKIINLLMNRGQESVIITSICTKENGKPLHKGLWFPYWLPEDRLELMDLSFCGKLLLHYIDISWAPWRFKSPVNWLCIQQLAQSDRKKSNIRITGSLRGETTGDRWVPSQKANNAENVSLLWCHHG